jgi:cellobiose transport system substrate-binding protein
VKPLSQFTINLVTQDVDLPVHVAQHSLGGTQNFRRLSVNNMKLSAKIFTLLAGATLAAGSLGGIAPAQAVVDCKNAEQDGNGCTVVSFAYFGDVLNGQLVNDYRKIHPEIKIQEIKSPDLDTLNGQNLRTQCAAGGVGNPDIAAIEVSYSGYWRSYPQCFVDLSSMHTTVGNKSAANIKNDYLSWRWDQGVAHDGKVIGIPTDVGGLEVAYRWDMFKIVKLPYQRDEVAKAWNTWDKFIAFGKEYSQRIKLPEYKSEFTKARTAPKGFMDNVGTIFAAYLNKGTEKYYKANGKLDGQLVYKTNPAIRKAFDLTLKADANGIGTRIGQYSSDWNVGMQNGTFAVILSPAWMLDYIKAQAPDTEGKWDIATMPGGGGNQGGSQLSIPAGAVHKQEAWDFITWYLAPAQQLKMFQYTGGIFPSTKALYTNKALVGKPDDFFNKAYTGKIYAAGIKNLKPIYEGKQQRCIDQEFGNALSLVINKKEKNPSKAYSGALTIIDRKCK